MTLAPPEQVIERLHELQNRTILVVGDVVLDQYVVGRATRLSREAPVPVLVHEESFSLPGSAANPALNIQSVGSQALQVAAIGDDREGSQLLTLLSRAGVDTQGVIRVQSRKTTVKQRILARGSLRYPQQLARVDYIEDKPLPTETLLLLAETVQELAGRVDAILVSDYHGGTVSGPVLEACLSQQSSYHIPVLVDAQSSLRQYRGATCIKCNREEACRALGTNLEHEEDYRSATQEILSSLSVDMVAITRGAEGISVRHVNGGYIKQPAPNKSEVFDVVGAGDTVIALLALGLVAGWDVQLAATVAQLGAGIVIQRLGNATPTLPELELAARRWL